MDQTESGPIGPAPGAEYRGAGIRDEVDVSEDQTKSHWLLTLPGILTGVSGIILAIGTLVGVLAANNLLPGQHETTEKSAPATSSTGSPGTPIGPLPGTDAQGFLDSDARCDPGNPAAAMGRTKQSLLVLCQTGPGAFYYRGVRRNAGGVITLTNAVQSSGGFDVTNPNDGTRYQIRPEGLTILIKDRQPVTEPWESARESPGYWSR
jgi:hypothetical protein